MRLASRLANCAVGGKGFSPARHQPPGTCARGPGLYHKHPVGLAFEPPATVRWSSTLARIQNRGGALGGARFQRTLFLQRAFLVIW